MFEKSNSKPQPKPQPQSKSRSNQTSRFISPKQKGLIKSLIRDGFLEDQHLNDLNMKEASDLITEGLDNKKSGTKIEETKETEFAGSYNQGDLFGF